MSPKHLSFRGNPETGWCFIRELYAPTEEGLQVLIDCYEKLESIVVVSKVREDSDA